MKTYIPSNPYGVKSDYYDNSDKILELIIKHRQVPESLCFIFDMLEK